MNIQYPDYDNSILSVTNSFLKAYGAKHSHATLPILDALLTKRYRNVILLVMDGMGCNVLKTHLPADSFLRRHIISDVSSVYPCTTTAAINTFQSGDSPHEHGWIGWSCYFKEVDKCIDLFLNRESGTDQPACEENQPYKYLNYTTIASKIRQATDNKVKVCAVSPFAEYFADTLEGICETVEKLCADSERKFIYAYHYEPDLLMHDIGITASAVKEMMQNYNARLEQLAKQLADTLLIITADHGMTDVTTKCIEDYPELNAMLKRHICVEPRCCSFYIKEEYKKAFPLAFEKAFEGKFKLYTHDAFLSSGLTGGGAAHPKVDEFVGDYMAVAISDIALWYKDTKGEYHDFKAAHAGLTTEEMRVPLIAVSCK